MRNSKSGSQVIGEVLNWYSKDSGHWCKGRWFSDRNYKHANQPGNMGFDLFEFMQEEAACLAGSLALMQGLWQNTGVIDSFNLPCTISIAEAIEELFPDRVENKDEGEVSVIISFNDNAETTIEDVQLVLKHALEEELEREEKLNEQELENIRIAAEIYRNKEYDDDYYDEL